MTERTPGVSTYAAGSDPDPGQSAARPTDPAPSTRHSREIASRGSRARLAVPAVPTPHRPGLAARRSRAGLAAAPSHTGRRPGLAVRRSRARLAIAPSATGRQPGLAVRRSRAGLAIAPSDTGRRPGLAVRRSRAGLAAAPFDTGRRLGLAVRRSRAGLAAAPFDIWERRGLAIRRSRAQLAAAPLDARQRRGRPGRHNRARLAGTSLEAPHRPGFAVRRSRALLAGATLFGAPRRGVARQQRRGPAGRRSGRSRGPFAIASLAAPVLLLATLGCDARLHLYIHGGRETLLPGRAYGDALVTQGIVASVPPGRGLPPGEPARRFVLRHPARFPDWNGTLVIGAHRGLGGIRRGEGGEELGTGETELDDLVGWWALDEGFAWAGFDRAGLGAGPEGYRLTEAFARLMFDQVRPRLAKDPERTILLGYGAGGGLARYAAAAEDETFDGALLVAATLADPEAAARRREARLALAPDWASLPADTPETADPGAAPHPSLAAYAEAAGMPMEGRRFWPFHDALAAAYPVPVLPGPPALLLRPVVEVVGALDDFVLPEVLSYRERTQQAGSAALHDLRLVPGAWRFDPEDDALNEIRAQAKALGLTPAQQAALATGARLAVPVRRALDDLDRRLRAGE